MRGGWLTAACAVSMVGCGASVLQVPVLGFAARAVAVGDLDGDARPDLVVASPRGVVVLLQAPERRFRDPVEYVIDGGVSSLRLADFDGDGRRDILARADGEWELLFNRGSGDFRPPTATGEPYGLLEVGDFDGDGKSDLYRVPSGPGPSSRDDVELGLGDGTFRTQALGFTSLGLVADLDHDGKADLLEASADGGVRARLSTGSGAFRAVATGLAAGSLSQALFAEVTGDGFPDLVRFSGTGFEVLPGLGDGRFGLPLSTPLEAGPLGVVVADFDGDGRQDLAIVATGLSRVDLFLGAASGPPRPAGHAPPPTPPVTALTAMDLDGDGRAELLYLDAQGLVILGQTVSGTFEAWPTR